MRPSEEPRPPCCPAPAPLPTCAAAALAGRKLDKDRALATLPAINALKKLCCHPDMVGGGAGGSGRR